jgi:hypothetical protein
LNGGDVDYLDGLQSALAQSMDGGELSKYCGDNKRRLDNVGAVVSALQQYVADSREFMKSEAVPA